ncbi:MAG: RHS repeat-associated core domain-containing protein [Bryobacteraceae bacterium]
MAPRRRRLAAPAPPLPTSVTYTYDLADRLISIAAPSGSTTSFTIDALGRHASQTISGSPVSSYSYLGNSDIVVAIKSGSTTTISAIDALGSRVATSSGGAFGYLLGDLHGNQAAAFNQAGTAVSDAFAYDAWGVVVASVTSALPTPWRYQGRMLESAAGTPDLYDFQARSYNPALGTFTSLDSKLGSAQNTALLNGYLYANANPATLVDPDGHSATDCPVFYCGTAAQKAANAAADTSEIAEENARANARAQANQAAGCPVQYCGTEDQKAANAAADTAMQKAMEEIAQQNAAQAAAEAERQRQAAWDAAHRDCGFANLGCFDPGQAVSNIAGTANQAWQNTGGAAVNAVCSSSLAYTPAAMGMCFDVQNPGAALVLGTTAGLCAAGLLAGGQAEFCLPLAGVAAYTAGNWANNILTKGDLSPTDGWRWQDAAITAAGVTAVGLLPESLAVRTVGGVAIATGAAMGIGGAAGFGSDVASQIVANGGVKNINWTHALCQGAVGAYSGAYVAGSLTGNQAVANLEKGAVWGAGTAVFGAGFCSQAR